MATAVVAAGGSGERLGAGLPKALVPIHGRPMIAWCLDALQRSERVLSAVIAAPPGHEEPVEAIAGDSLQMPFTITTGGGNRSESVANAIAAVDGSEELLIHDAARPLVSPELVDRCIERLINWRCDGVVAAARAVDTIKEADAGGRVIATLERGTLWAVQTPQVFQAGALRRALAEGDLARATDDAQLVEAVGGDIRIVEAPRHNLKITTEQDLRIAELLLNDLTSEGRV
jgi:2-C-methyl-D-erythritol 4-phosphate cytidylyltransferase